MNPEETKKIVDDEDHSSDEEFLSKSRPSHIPQLTQDIANLDSVLTYHEEIAPEVERKLANNLDHAFAPIRIFMLCLLRFPLMLRVNADFSREFAYSWKSFRGWMFFITGAVMSINALLIALTLTAIMLDYPPQPKEYWGKVQDVLRLEELFLLQRNFVPVLILLLALCHVCTGDVSLFVRRTFISKYFTFWDEAVEIMKMDAAKYPEDVRSYLMKVIYFYGGFLVIFFGLALVRFAPLSTGAPVQLVILWARLFYPPIHAWIFFGFKDTIVIVLKACGSIVFTYIVMCSKVYVLLLLYKCKILKNSFATWNGRLESVLHTREEKSRKEECQTRTGFDHLFRDYVVLLDLLHGADTMFTNVIESYYGTQVFSLCFEVYYFIRSFSAHKEFQGARRLDGVLMGVFLFHSVIMLVLSSTAASEVGEVAMEGLEIIRRKGVIGRKSNDEMYFTLSLYMSFTGHFETALTGGRFVIFDRDFIVALVGTIFSYFIILSQFTPPLAMLDPDKLHRLGGGEETQKLIEQVEHTKTYLEKFKVGYDVLGGGNLTVF